MKKSRLLRAVYDAVFAAFCLISISLHAEPISGQGTWETTLQPRDLDGNTVTIEAFYDTVLDITWLADANAAVGSAYDTHDPGTGHMNWTDANAWAASLNFNGITNWRLPTNIDDGQPVGYNVPTTSGSPPYPADMVYSEMATMYYDTLGNIGLFDTSGVYQAPGFGLTNTGLFTNIRISSYYWSSMDYSPTTGHAWNFGFYGGFQWGNGKNYSNMFAWAVHSGDVGAVIVPINSDSDPLPDYVDNCLATANAGQSDSDEDGLGNACDPDIYWPNNCVVDFYDLGTLSDAFFSDPVAPNWNPDADFTGDDRVNFADLAVMTDFFFAPPGPSGVANICEP